MRFLRTVFLFLLQVPFFVDAQQSVKTAMEVSTTDLLQLPKIGKLLSEILK